MMFNHECKNSHKRRINTLNYSSMKEQTIFNQLLDAVVITFQQCRLQENVVPLN